MDILTSNQTTTRKFTIELQESKDRWKAIRQEIRDKIAETATSQARLMLSEEDDIGNPAQLCEELSKLRLEYTEIIVQEKEEQAKIMQEYTEQTIINMGQFKFGSVAKSDDMLKLRVYEKYIQNTMEGTKLLLERDRDCGIPNPKGGGTCPFGSSTHPLRECRSWQCTTLKTIINKKIAEEQEK